MRWAVPTAATLAFVVLAGCGPPGDANELNGGTTGPDLDEVLAGRGESFIRESIVDPDATVAEGFQSGVMPGDYASRLSRKELDELVAYLHDVTR